MSISGSFSNALSGLTVTGRRAEVTSNNLANALTKGYARQSVDVASSALNGRGSGARLLGVTRNSVPDLTASRRLADGDAAALEPQAESLARLGAALGEATADDGLFRRIETLESSLRGLSETPESEPRQIAVVEAARDVASFLNQFSSTVSIERQNADSLIASQVDTVNHNVRQIEALNDKITRLSTGGRDVASLIDQRELLIDEVAAILPVRALPLSNGKIYLTTNQGQFLLAERPVELQFTRSPIITADMTFDPIGGGALSGISLAGQDLTPGAAGAQVITAGALFGNFAIRDQIALDLNTQIDEFAADLIRRFEDPAVDPTLAAGDPGLFTDNGGPLDPLLPEGTAARIGLNAAVDPAQGGDPARLRDGLSAVAPGPAFSATIPRSYLDTLQRQDVSTVTGVSGNLSSFQLVTGIAEFTGERRSRTEVEASSLVTTRESLAANEAREIGVDQDDELASLIQIEQAFAANIQVIQTAARMLDELTGIR